MSYCDVIDTWAAGYCDVTLTDYSDAVSVYGRFHQNGVASQERFNMTVQRSGIYRSALLRFRGRIEIGHLHGLRWSDLFCHSGTARVGPAVARPIAVAPAGPTKAVRDGKTNHSSADRIAVNSYSKVRLLMIQRVCGVNTQHSSIPKPIQ